MNGPRRLPAAFVCVAVLALAGCGGTATRSTTHARSPTVPVTTGQQLCEPDDKVGAFRGSLARSSFAGWERSITAAPARAASTPCLDPSGVFATETAYVEGADRQHLRGGTIQPGARRVRGEGACGRSELWHVIQSTEPETLDARIAITVGNGCAAQWLARVGVISHAGAWSPPPPWL